jgi:Ca-activated chloride channel family protein
MNGIRKFSTVLPLIILLFANAFGQTPKPTPKITEEEGVIKVDSRLVVVPVAVTNANGEPAIGLTTKDFRVLEEGRAQVIENVGGADSTPLEIALLFDVSASTDAMFKFEQETAAKFLKDVLRPEDRATIYTIGERLNLVQARATSDASMNGIRSITPTKQQTAFYDAVRQAAVELARNTPEGRRKVLVVISDGEDTNSDAVLRAIWNAERKLVDGNISNEKLREVRVKARDTAKFAEQQRVVKAIQDADAVFYSVNPAGSSVQLNSMSRFGQDNMQKFASETGGTAFLPKFQPIDTKDPYQNQINTKANTEVLDRIFRQLTNELRAQYLVQYYSDGEYPQNKFVKLNIGLPNRSDLKIRAREGYYVKN